MNELSLLDTFFGNGGFSAPFGAGCQKGFPSVDVEETNDEYTFLMDLPGRTEKDVEISLKEDILTISSAKREEKTEKKDGTWLIRERRTSDFKRSFSLPKDIDSDKVSASFKNGVLGIRIGKKAAAAEKKIAIQIA